MNLPEARTKRKWAEQVLQTLRFLSNMSQLEESWINGKGIYSPNYEEAMRVLHEVHGFNDKFPKMVASLKLETPVGDALKACQALLSQYQGAKSEPEILADAKWHECMRAMARAASMLEVELKNFPTEIFWS